MKIGPSCSILKHGRSIAVRHDEVANAPKKVILKRNFISIVFPVYVLVLTSLRMA